MIRTQIQLTEDQARRLRAAARRESISLAEMIRRCVDRAFADDILSRSDLYARAAELVGAFHDRDDATDLSAHHDDYLVEAYE